jgi:tripartite-type tricarboxylate transporter receptor subunit TctC
MPAGLPAPFSILTEKQLYFKTPFHFKKNPMRQLLPLIKPAAWLLCVGLAFGAAAPATAQDFPKGPVKIIIPFPPGGPTDTVGRLIGMKLQEIWGQPVIIDYKAGAGTVIGVDFVAKSAPDGYTFGMVNSSLAVNPTLRKSLPYNTTKDLAGITQLANLQLAIVARPDAPFNTLPELIAYAKKNPGKLTYGTPGAGSTTHLGAELLKREAGFDMLHSPFKGSAPAHTELMGGRIDIVVDPFLSVLPYVKAGRMKMIATMGDKRVSGFNYPIVADVLPGFSVNALLGFVAPAGTPRAVIQKIQADTAKVLADPEVKKRIEEQGMEIVGSKPEQFDAFIQAELKRWHRVVTEAKIEAD